MTLEDEQITRQGLRRRAAAPVDVMSAQVAIVAGAGGGLGHATTAALAAGGLTVVAVDRNGRGLRDLPDGVCAKVADTTDPAVAARPRRRSDR